MPSMPKRVNKRPKKSVDNSSCQSESRMPIWLKEEPGKSETSDSEPDPWLSGNAVVANLPKSSSDDTDSIAASVAPTAFERSHVERQKRPRTSSASESPSRSKDFEDSSSQSSSNESSVTESADHDGGGPDVPPVAGIVPSSSSGSGEDIVIDDCTLSDDGEDIIIGDCTFGGDDDCVVLETPTPTGRPSSSAQSAPSSRPPASVGPPHPPDPAESGGSAPFGLDEVVAVDESTVLVTTAPQFCLLLWGAYQVRVLRGAVRVHGATLTPARPDYLSVFALRVKALPPLRPAEDISDDASKCTTDDPSKEVASLPKPAAAALRGAAGCALLVRRLPGRLLPLLADQFGDTFTPRAGDTDDLVLSHTGCWLLREAAELGRLQLSPHLSSGQWEQRLQRLAARSAAGERVRVAFAGGKGVGKSTWMYYLLNMLLNSSDHVYVLDVDPGQAEFTPCACLSLVKVDTPLVGPSFTHLTKPVRSMFVGEVSVANDPFGYLAAAQQLVTEYRQRARADPAPLLLNTMGWANGLGEDLLLEVLAMVQPTDLLEVFHPTKQKVNFERPLSPTRVNGAGRSWLMQKYLPPGAPGRPPVSYRHSRLESLSQPADNGRQTSSGLAPWMYRQLNTTAFVAALERPDRTLCQLTPVCVPWSRLAVHVNTQQIRPQHVMHAINGTVVALCWTDAYRWRPPEDPSLFSLLPEPHDRPPCVGFGLVRGVDAGRRLLYLLTDLGPGELGSVNTVIRGPHHLLAVFPADSGLRSWTPALTGDQPAPPLHRPDRRYKRGRPGALRARGGWGP